MSKTFPSPDSADPLTTEEAALLKKWSPYFTESETKPLRTQLNIAKMLENTAKWVDEHPPSALERPPQYSGKYGQRGALQDLLFPSLTRGKLE